MKNEIQKVEEDWRYQVPHDVSGLVRKGMLSIGGFIVLFTLWGALFPINSAVVVSGSIVSDGQNKLIQHPIGGRVEKIHAQDGQLVRAGAPLLTLDTVSDQAKMRKLEVRLMAQKAIQARLEAQMANADKILFPKELVAKSFINVSFESDGSVQPQNSVFAGLIADQQAEFKASQLRLQKQLAILNEQIKSIEQKVLGRKAVVQSMEQRIASYNEQIEKMRPAVKKGYIAKIRLQDVNNQLLDLRGQFANAKAEIQSSSHKKMEVTERIKEYLAQFHEQTAEKLGLARGQVGELKNEIRAARWAFGNNVLKAPVNGVLTNFKANTVGGTVPANEIIAEIVPENSRLIAEVRVMPKDINNVKIGDTAEIAINAFNQRLVDNIKAKVVYISADSQINSNTGETYFTVRLSLAEQEKNSKNKIHVGMQGEVYIITGRRVFFSYMLKPITDSFSRAFREQ